MLACSDTHVTIVSRDRLHYTEIGTFIFFLKVIVMRYLQNYSTVTDFARFLGLSTSVPLIIAT
jgi:hypothetical protein